MGDRRMAEIRVSSGSLYVYTHSDGYQLPKLAIDAIQFAKPRWNDHAYALRIIVDQLTKSGRDEEYGWGLMLEPNHEDEYNFDQPSVLIDLVDRQLTVIGREKAVELEFEDLPFAVKA